MIHLVLGLFLCHHVCIREITALQCISKVSTNHSCGFGYHPCNDANATCLHQRFWCDGEFNCPNHYDESSESCSTQTGMFCQFLGNTSPYKVVSRIPTVTSDCYLTRFPTGCECTHGAAVTCKAAGLHTVPQDIRPGANLTKLFLSGNNITDLSAGIFTAYPGLILLHLSNNDIEFVHHDAFNGLLKLKGIMMEHNRISIFWPGTFSNVPRLTLLYLKHNQLTDFHPDVFAGNHEIQWLDLRNNKLQLKRHNQLSQLSRTCQYLELDDNQVTDIDDTVLRNFTKLTMLSLADNELQEISANAFQDLTSLAELILSGNQLTKLHARQFAAQSLKLRDIDLSNNLFKYLPETVFQPLEHLANLKLAGFEIRNISRRMFGNLPIEHIDFKKFYYCGYAPNVRDCSPKTDGISTTKNLLENSVLKFFAWTIGVLALFVNGCVLVARAHLWKESSQLNKVHSLCISTLATSDIMMGIYMFIISATDEKYRNQYHLHSHVWVQSSLCRFSGFLSVVSSEVSTLLLVFMAVDRYYRIIWKPFARIGAANLRATAGWIAVCWVSGLIIGVIPLFAELDSDGVQVFYGQNGVCLPMFIHEPYFKGWWISALIFIVTPVLAIMVITYCYLTIIFHVEKSRQASDRVRADRRHLKKVLAITISNNISWLTIISIKVLALLKVEIPGEVYGWMAVFVLPVNCCLNPIIYTLMTQEFNTALGRLPCCRTSAEAKALQQITSYASGMNSMSRNSITKRSLRATGSVTTLSSRFPASHQNSVVAFNFTRDGSGGRSSRRHSGRDRHRDSRHSSRSLTFMVPKNLEVEDPEEDEGIVMQTFTDRESRGSVKSDQTLSQL